MIEQVRTRAWAGHVSRIQDNRWTFRITTWKPYERKRPRERPTRWWRYKLNDYWKGTIWQRIAQDKQMWKQHAEAFAQPWDTTGLQLHKDDDNDIYYLLNGDLKLISEISIKRIVIHSDLLFSTSSSQMDLTQDNIRIIKSTLLNLLW